MANIKFTAKEEAFVAAMYKASGAVGVLAAKINTDLVRSYREADAVQRILNKGIVRFGEDAMATGQKLSIGLTAPILALGAAGIKSFADVEALLMGLEVVEGSSNAAASSFERIKAIAKAPGLGFMEAAQGYTNLRAVGFGADFAEKSLKNLGNALALSGKGKFEFGSILTQLTQMSSKSAVLAEDLKPILNSAPVIAKLLKEMYGSVDSEAISNQLKAQGKGPADFINELMTALDGVKKVSGGAKNAIENMGDSLKIAGSNIGEVVNKSTGLTSAITNAGDAVVDITEWFKELSPEMQNFIIYSTAGAAAIGPVTYGVGSLAAALPGLITSISMAKLITGGWIVALGSLAAVMASGYAEHQKFLKITQDADATIRDAERSVHAETMAITKNLQVVREGIGTTEQIKKAKAELSALSPALRSALQGETIDFIKLNDAAADQVRVINAIATAKAFAKQKADAAAGNAELRSGGGLSLAEELAAKMKLNKVPGGKDGGFTVADHRKQMVYEKSLQYNKTIKMAAEAEAKIIKENNLKLEQVYGDTGNKLTKVIVKTAKTKTEAIKEAVKKPAEQYVDEVALAVESMMEANKNMTEMFNRLSDPDWAQMKKNIPNDVVPTTPLNMDLLAAETERQKMLDLYEGYTNDLEAFQANFGYMLKDGLGDSIGTFFENLASGEGFGGSFKGMMGSLTSTLGSLLMDFGKKALLAEKAIAAIKVTFGSGPWAAVGAIALGGIIKGYGQSLKAPKFAQGGIVKGPGLATVGDNPGRFEAIIPIEKMPSIFGKMVQQNNNGYIATVDVALDRLRIGLARLEKNM